MTAAQRRPGRVSPAVRDLRAMVRRAQNDPAGVDAEGAAYYERLEEKCRLVLAMPSGTLLKGPLSAGREAALREQVRGVLRSAQTARAAKSAAAAGGAE